MRPLTQQSSIVGSGVLYRTLHDHTTAGSGM